MVRLITAEDGRFLRLTKQEFEPDFGVLIEESNLPEGDLADYKYINNEFIYDPLPAPPEPVDEMQQMKDQIEELSQSNQMLTDCILEMSELLYQ